MTLLDEMTSYWSQQVAQDISNATIELLESKKDLFYEYDNCLSSNWEGFCVQIQEKVSIIELDKCLVQIDSLFMTYYELLPKEEQFTLWLQTPHAKAWVSNTGNQTNDTPTYTYAPVEYDDCKELLLNVLTSMATCFKSESITRYINYVIRGEQIQEDDFEEEEEEYED